MLTNRVVVNSFGGFGKTTWYLVRRVWIEIDVLFCIRGYTSIYLDLKMAKIMDPVLPILSSLGYWSIIWGTFGGPGTPSVGSIYQEPPLLAKHLTVRFQASRSLVPRYMGGYQKWCFVGSLH